MCTIAAFMATIVFESPFIGLEKIIFGRTSSLDKKPLTMSQEKNYTELTTLESENKFEEQNQEQDGTLANETTDFQQNPYRQEFSDNISREA